VKGYPTFLVSRGPFPVHQEEAAGIDDNVFDTGPVLPGKALATDPSDVGILFDVPVKMISIPDNFFSPDPVLQEINLFCGDYRLVIAGRPYSSNGFGENLCHAGKNGGFCLQSPARENQKGLPRIKKSGKYSATSPLLKAYTLLSPPSCLLFAGCVEGLGESVSSKCLTNFLTSSISFKKSRFSTTSRSSRLSCSSEMV
jgi:hypothetical protein